MTDPDAALATFCREARGYLANLEAVADHTLTSQEWRLVDGILTDLEQDIWTLISSMPETPVPPPPEPEAKAERQGKKPRGGKPPALSPGEREVVQDTMAGMD